MTSERFVKDIAVYSVSSGATLVLAFVQSLIIPAFMSLEQFGYWRLFFLYISYAGFANIGFVDGALLRWAALDKSKIVREFKAAIIYLLLQQLLVLALGVTSLLLFARHPVAWLLTFIGLGIFVLNFLTLGKFYLQASKQFKRLSFATFFSASFFLSGVALLILVKHLTAPLVIIVYLIAVALSFIIMTGPLVLTNDWAELPGLNNIIAFGWQRSQAGIFVLFGNVGLVLVYTIDRLAVSWTRTIEQFAVYSFAATFVAVIYQLVSTISDVIFPYLMKLSYSQQHKMYQPGKHLIISIAGTALASYFPIRYIVTSILPEYASSLPVTRILLLSTCFSVTVRLLQVNYFKIRYRQRNFFLLGLIVNLTFLIGSVLVSQQPGLEHFAWLSLTMNFIWFFLNDLYLHYSLRLDFNGIARSLAAIAAYILLFWSMSSAEQSVWLGLIFYLVLASCITLVFLWPERKWFVAALLTTPEQQNQRSL